MELILVLDAARIINCDKKILIINLVQIQNFDYFCLFSSVNGYICKKKFWPVIEPILHQIHEFIVLRYIKQMGKKVGAEITKHPYV